MTDMIDTIRVALITGITGQDGSYLTELLLEKGYEVWGIIRKSSNFNTQRIDHLYNNEKLYLRYGDLTDSQTLSSVFDEIKKKDVFQTMSRFEIYNLGAMSHVKVSFDMPEYTANVDALGVLRLLEIIKKSDIKDKIYFYQASTSELFGDVKQIPQTETTQFNPQSPYALAKHFAFNMVKHYRETYGLFVCNGILFNHESERRGSTFVTKKITEGLNKILNGEIEELYMGNLNSKRDWGHAEDYVEGMWRMLQQKIPDDFILASNETHSIKEFIEIAFKLRGIKIKWYGMGLSECGINEANGKVLIRVSEKYFRPAEVEFLLGDYSKALDKLGWQPTCRFLELVKRMVDNDCPI